MKACSPSTCCPLVCTVARYALLSRLEDVCAGCLQASVISARSPRELLWCTVAALQPPGPPLPSPRLAFLGPHLRRARENVVLFLEGTATCRSKGGMEPEWVVISAITCAHVTGLARGPCGVNHSRPGIIAAFPFQLQKA